MDKRNVRFFVDFVLLLFFTALLGKGIYYLYDISGLQSLPIPGLDNFALYGMLIVLVIVLAYSFLTKARLAHLGFSLPKKEHLLESLIFFSLLFPVALVGRLLIPQFDFDYYNANIAVGILPFFIIMALFVMREELVERSLIQSSVSRYYPSLLVCLAVSINFSLMHLGWIFTLGWKNTLALVLSIFFGSFFLTLLFIRTKSLLATLFLHFLTNTFVVVQILLHVGGFVLSEVFFWLAWLVLFIVFLKRGLSLFRVLRFRQVSMLHWFFLLIFVIWPILLLFL